jgi:uncharacterized membrane protein
MLSMCHLTDDFALWVAVGAFRGALLGYKTRVFQLARAALYHTRHRRLEGSTGMSGTTADLIPIVIIPIIVLAFWLRMLFYVDSHPRWGSQAPPDTVSTHALPGSATAQRLSGPGPVIPGQRPSTAGDEVTPGQAQASRRE